MLVCLSLPVSGWASSVNVYFEQQASVVTVGDTFTVDIMADISVPVLGWGLDVTFDSMFLMGNGTPTIGASWNAGVTQDKDGLAGATFPLPVSGHNILLATLSFEAIAPGMFDLSLGITENDFSEGFALTTPGQFAEVAFQAGSITVNNPVPIPGAVWLLGSGLMGFGFHRRKRGWRLG